MLKKSLITSVVFFAVLSKAVAQSPCDIPAAAKGVKRIAIDARTGQFIGSKHYSRTENVELVIFNKNPFRYTYRLDVKEEAIPEAGLEAFLPLIVPSQFEKPKEESKEKPKPAAAPPGADVPEPCPGLNSFENTHDGLGKARDTIQSNMVAAKTSLDDASTAYTAAKIVLESPNSDCAALFSKATAIRTTLTTALATVNLTAIADALDKLAKDAKAQFDAVQKYRLDHPNCPSQRTEFLLERAELLSRPVEMQSNLDKLKKTKQTLDEALTKLNLVLGSGPAAFTEFRALGEYDEATAVTVSLDRKDAIAVDSKFENVTSSKVSFGGPSFFTFAGGIAGSSIDRVQFTPIQGYALPKPGGDPDRSALTNIIGEKEASSSRVTPLVMLHGRIYDARAFMPASFQFSVGLSAKNDNLGTDIEYLVGPTLGLLDNKLFITVGAYGGREQKLQGDLFVGAKIPQELTTIPVRKDLVWRPGFAVTYKIK